MPYQPGTTRRRGYPCCGSSGCAVHGPDDEDVVAQRHLARQAAAVGVLVAAVEAAVGADEGDLDDVVEQAGALEQVPQRRAGPLGRADRLVGPGHALVARGHSCAPVAGAFQRHPQRARGQPLDVLERERDGVAHAPGDLDPPVVVGHVGHVEMREQIMHARRRHVVAQGLEQNAGVAVGQPDLVGVKRTIGGRPPLGIEEWIGGRHRAPALLATVRHGASLAETIPLAAATCAQG